MTAEKNKQKNKKTKKKKNKLVYFGNHHTTPIEHVSDFFVSDRNASFHFSGA